MGEHTGRGAVLKRQPQPDGEAQAEPSAVLDCWDVISLLIISLTGG